MQTHIRRFQCLRERLPYCTVIPSNQPWVLLSRIKGIGMKIETIDYQWRWTTIQIIEPTMVAADVQKTASVRSGLVASIRRITNISRRHCTRRYKYLVVEICISYANYTKVCIFLLGFFSRLRFQGFCLAYTIESGLSAQGLYRIFAEKVTQRFLRCRIIDTAILLKRAPTEVRQQSTGYDDGCYENC